jgi:hypothetical protein
VRTALQPYWTLVADPAEAWAILVGGTDWGALVGLDDGVVAARTQIAPNSSDVLNASVARLASGDYVVSWIDGSSTGPSYRVVTLDGTTLALETDTTTPNASIPWPSGVGVEDESLMGQGIVQVSSGFVVGLHTWVYDSTEPDDYTGKVFAARIRCTSP